VETFVGTVEKYTIFKEIWNTWCSWKYTFKW